MSSLKRIGGLLTATVKSVSGTMTETDIDKYFYKASEEDKRKLKEDIRSRKK